MKKYIATFLSCALLLSSFSFSFALEDIEHTEAKPDTLTVEEIQALSNLPIFITTIKSDNIDKENIGELIDSIQNSPIAFHNSPSDSNQNETAVLTNEEYDIYELSDIQKNDLLTNPQYSLILKRLNELNSSDFNISYVNFYSYQKDTSIANMNQDGIMPLGSSVPFGSYNGYDYVYYEAQARFDTDPVVPGNLTAKMDWTEVAKKTLGIVVDEIIDGYCEAISTTVSFMSAFFSGYKAPIKVKWNSSEDEFFVAAKGDYYIREICIQDKLNKVSGQDYVPYAITERISFNLSGEIWYPCKQNPSGTYERETIAFSTNPRTQVKTPSYDKNTAAATALLKEIYSRYMGAGYMTYDEHFDTSSFFTKLFS